MGAQGKLWVIFSGQELSFSVLCLLKAVKISESCSKRHHGWSSAPVKCVFIPVMRAQRKVAWTEPLIHIYPGPNCLSHGLTPYVILLYQIFIIYLICHIWLIKCSARCIVIMLGLNVVCGTSLWEWAERLALSLVLSASVLCLSAFQKMVIRLEVFFYLLPCFSCRVDALPRFASDSVNPHDWHKQT